MARIWKIVRIVGVPFLSFILGLVLGFYLVKAKLQLIITSDDVKHLAAIIGGGASITTFLAGVYRFWREHAKK